MWYKTDIGGKYSLIPNFCEKNWRYNVVKRHVKGAWRIKMKQENNILLTLVENKGRHPMILLSHAYNIPTYYYM